MLTQAISLSARAHEGQYRKDRKTPYVAHVFRNTAAGLAFGAVLAALYGALYMLLRADDYALLAGSLLLFGLLAGLMFATRRVAWYRLTRAAPVPSVSREAPS